MVGEVRLSFSCGPRLGTYDLAGEGHATPHAPLCTAPWPVCEDSWPAGWERKPSPVVGFLEHIRSLPLPLWAYILCGSSASSSRYSVLTRLLWELMKLGFAHRSSPVICQLQRHMCAQSE